MGRRIRTVVDFVVVYALYFRKELISTIILTSTLLTIIFLGPRNSITYSISTVGIAVLTTDYRILKHIHKPLYNWIEKPTSQIWPEQAIEFALDLVRVNYYAKKYEEIGNPEMPIINSKGNELAVDSADTHQQLTEGMVFQVYYEDTIQHGNEDLPAPRRLGLARIEEVTPTVSWLTVTEWYNDHPRQERAIRRGRLDNLDAYVKAKMSEEVQNSKIDELEEAYQSVRTISHNRGQLST